MLHNYLAAALRNLVRNRLYAAINIVGLAVGLMGALLISLFIRDEYSYDTWVPGHERTYIVRQEFYGPAFNVIFDNSIDKLADWMRSDLPEVESVARLSKLPTAQPPMAGLRHGEVEGSERLYWADANIFAVLPLPSVAGNLATALMRPDGLVLTRRMARKYFGRDDPIGETIELDRTHVMTVTAVIEDLPSNTHLNFDFLASGRAAFSDLTLIDQHPWPQQNGAFTSRVMTYVRLKPGASIDAVRAEMTGLLDRHGVTAALAPLVKTGARITFPLTAINDIHLSPGMAQWLMKPRGSLTTIYALGAVAALLVLVAVLNFVNLMTARGARRAVEVGVRKVSGAMRRHLALQFMSEAIIYVAVGLFFAALLVAALTPSFNAYLQRDSISLDFWQNRSHAGALICAAIFVGLLAGVYPALVLPSFNPAAVLSRRSIRNISSSLVREGFVVLQFAVLIVLVVATLIIYRQARFAFDQTMRLDTSQMLLVRTNCTTPFKEKVRELSGVAGAACSSSMALNYERIVLPAKHGDAATIPLDAAVVDFGCFELYGLRPLAGRFFDPGQGIDAGDSPSSIVINETAVRKFGFTSNEAAIGQPVELTATFTGPYHPGLYQIVGVVSDFSIDAIHTQIGATGYFRYRGGPEFSQAFLNIKLAGAHIPETLAAIDALWKTTGEPKPMRRTFLDQRIQEVYLDVTRQSQLFAAFCGLAVFIACLGLFGLAAFTAETRTKEIGVRKAMGASSGNILTLLLWEFAKPVLWANVIAWPAGYLAMHRWLKGFAYHVTLSPWVFAAASGLALAIAVATVAGHAVLVARSQPVAALRYE